MEKGRGAVLLTSHQHTTASTLILACEDFTTGKTVASVSAELWTSVLSIAAGSFEFLQEQGTGIFTPGEQSKSRDGAGCSSGYEGVAVPGVRGWPRGPAFGGASGG
jgi:hypothetical protein